MEVVRSGERGNYVYSMLIESVGEDNTPDIIQFAQYNVDGRLIVSGGSSNYTSGRWDVNAWKEELLQHGHFRTCELPSRINFGETVKRFLLKAVNLNPSFETPELVPFTESAQLTNTGLAEITEQT